MPKQSLQPNRQSRLDEEPGATISLRQPASRCHGAEFGYGIVVGTNVGTVRAIG